MGASPLCNITQSARGSRCHEPVAHHAFCVTILVCQSGEPLMYNPQWEAADAEIKVPFGENTELKRPPFKV